MASKKQVNFKEYHFEEYLDEPTILKAVATMAAQIAHDYRDKNPLFIVVLNGAYVFAADLLREIPFNCETSFIKLKSYAGFKSTEKVEQLLGLESDISGRDIILIEDIIDTGNTLNKFLPVVREHGVASVRIASLLFKTTAFRHSYPIDYIGIEIPDDFVIGYGLDYDNHGRNLRSIYRKLD